MSKSIFSKVAAVACSVAAVVAMSISASAASAEGKKLDPELTAGVTNLVATKVQVDIDDLKAANYQVKYDVEVANNQGFGPSGIRLVYPSDSKFTVVLNEDEEPATSPRDAVTGDLNNEITQNPDKFNVAVGYMGKKNTKGDGLMFYVDFKLPETAKVGDKFELKLEVDKFLDKDNNKVDYKTVDGFIEIVDDVVTTTTAPVTTPVPPTTTTTQPPVVTTVPPTTTTVVTTAPPTGDTTTVITSTSNGTTAAGKGTTTTKATTKANGVKTGDTGAGVAVAALLLAAGTAVVAAKKKED